MFKLNLILNFFKSRLTINSNFLSFKKIFKTIHILSILILSFYIILFSFSLKKGVNVEANSRYAIYVQADYSYPAGRIISSDPNDPDKNSLVMYSNGYQKIIEYYDYGSSGNLVWTVSKTGPGTLSSTTTPTRLTIPANATGEIRLNFYYKNTNNSSSSSSSSNTPTNNNITYTRTPTNCPSINYASGYNPSTYRVGSVKDILVQADVSNIGCDGYEFYRWVEETNTTGEFWYKHDKNTTYRIFSSTVGNIQLRAEWLPISTTTDYIFLESYTSEGHICPDPTIVPSHHGSSIGIYTNGTTQTYDIVAPACNGYEFNFWDNREGLGTSINNISDQSATLTITNWNKNEPITIFASYYKTTTYSINYNSVISTCNVTNAGRPTTYQNSRNNQTLDLGQEPTCNGYDFNGWTENTTNTSIDGNNLQINGNSRGNIVVSANWTLQNGWGGNIPCDNYYPEGWTISNINLNDAELRVNQNFGCTYNIAICFYVFYDDDFDGILDSQEYGIPNTNVELRRSSNNELVNTGLSLADRSNNLLTPTCFTSLSYGETYKLVMPNPPSATPSTATTYNNIKADYTSGILNFYFGFSIGDIHLNLPSSFNFENVSVSSNDIESCGLLENINVIDTRGNDPGWTVTFTVSDFIGSNKNLNVSNNLTNIPQDLEIIENYNSGNNRNLGMARIIESVTDSTTLMYSSSNNGRGVTNINLASCLKIPSFSRPDLYSSIYTFTIF